MSADKRKQILIVFAALAVVLVGVIAYVSPNFRNEDVSGAIGAVQKHREPQIQPQDVVLGDESVKQEARILYGDFLTDAAALRNLSADVAVAARNAEASMKLRDTELAARKKDLKRRFIESMSASVVEARKFANEEQEAQLGRKKLDAILAEADALERAVRNEEQLADEDMAQLSKRLAAMVESFSWGSRKLADSEAQLARMIRNSDEDGAKATLAKAVNALDARSAAMKLRNEVEYAAAIAKEAKAVANVEEALASEDQLAARKGIIAILIGEADQLEAKAFANIEEQFASEAELAAHLARMTAMVESGVGESDNYARSRSRLEDEQAELQARGAAHAQIQLADFEANLAAVERLNVRLANDAELARRLRNDEALAAMREQLRRMSAVEGKSVQASTLEQRAIRLASRQR